MSPTLRGSRLPRTPTVTLPWWPTAGVQAEPPSASSLNDVFYVAGSHDFLVHVAVRDVEHLRRLVAERLSTHEAIGHVETSLVFEHQHRSQWPDYSEPEPPPKARAAPEAAGARASKLRARRRG